MIPPIHRQFGSKARVAPTLLSLVPPGKRVWVEVFAGSAAVTFAKAPHPVEHINDLSGHVTNLFRVVRDPVTCAALIEAIVFTPYSQGDLLEARAQIRVSDPVEWARRFLIVSWMSVNGCHTGNTGYRMNRRERWHLDVWNRLPTRIADACRRLKNVTIHSTHCMDIVRKFGGEADTVLFCDPPYPQEVLNTGRSSVYEFEMTDGEHADLCNALRAAKAAVILTMNPGTIYSEILSDWNVLELPVRGLRNTTKTELIFTNFQPPLSLFGGAA